MEQNRKQNPTMSAAELAAQGYRRVSNTHRMVSRIDRPDWREHMAQRHAPWSFEQGMAWVKGLGDSAEDQYRRCYSQDKIEGLRDNVYSKIPGS